MALHGQEGAQTVDPSGTKIAVKIQDQTRLPPHRPVKMSRQSSSAPFEMGQEIVQPIDDESFGNDLVGRTRFPAPAARDPIC